MTELKAAGAQIVDPFSVHVIEQVRQPPQTRARTKDDLTKWFATHPGVPFPSVGAIAGSKLLHPLHQVNFDEAAAASRPDEDPVTMEGLKNEQLYRNAFTAAMDALNIDAVICPISAQFPPIQGDRNTQFTADPKPEPNSGPTAVGGSLTWIGSALQWPALSIPSGFLGEGVPQGLQILGRAWDEEKIIRFAYAYEQATHYRRPPPTAPPLATSLTNRFIGTWNLVAIRNGRSAAGKEPAAAAGRQASGQLIYATDGTLSLHMSPSGRRRRPGESLHSYFGRWALAPAEACVLHLLDPSMKATHTTEKLCYSFDAAGRLSLVPEPRPGVAMKDASITMVWERLP